MAEAAAEIVKEGAAAAEVAAKPNVYPVVISGAALLFIGLLIWRLVGVQIEVLQSMSQHISDLDSDLRHIGVPVGWTKSLRKQQTQQAVERDSE